jgi:hypothetical protein
MAKKTKTTTDAANTTAATPAGAPNAAAQAAAKAERVKNDVFVRNFKDGKPVAPNGKIPPQAMVIINGVEAGGKDGISRENLIKGITGILVTKQPVGRIVSYYQKLIQECGAVTIKAAS